MESLLIQMIERWGSIYAPKNSLLQGINWLLLEIYQEAKVDLFFYFYPRLYKYIGFSPLAIYLAVGDRYFHSK